MEYEQVTEGHVLTIKAPTKYAVLTGKLSALQKLLDEGITEIVFVTKEATSTFSLAELLAKGGIYRRIHDIQTNPEGREDGHVR